MLNQPAPLACNTKINYSKAVGDRILPFLIELDLAKSNLNPEPGENQRFCYCIKGIGTDHSKFADMEHLVLGICDKITKSEIVNISVKVNGIEKYTEFGTGCCVDLQTSQNPDLFKGCSGLILNFCLDKVEGQMIFSFELTKPYDIGPNEVCLFGGNAVAKGLSICGPVCEETQTCLKYAYQKASVCVPVEVIPFADPGDIKTFCCGEPIVTSYKDHCNGKCSFMITQYICVQVPVTFGADAFVGDPRVSCGTPSKKDICADCSTSNENWKPCHLKNKYKVYF